MISTPYGSLLTYLRIAETHSKRKLNSFGAILTFEEITLLTQSTVVCFRIERKDEKTPWLSGNCNCWFKQD